MSRKATKRSGAGKTAGRGGRAAVRRAGVRRKAGRPRRGRGKYLRARTAGIQWANRCAFGVLIAMGCVAIAILALPQVRKLQNLEGELAEVEEHEREVLVLKDRKTRELTALRTDPEYLELVARDRLDLYVPGERIIRVRRQGN